MEVNRLKLNEMDTDLARELVRDSLSQIRRFFTHLAVECDELDLFDDDIIEVFEDIEHALYVLLQDWNTSAESAESLM